MGSLVVPVIVMFQGGVKCGGAVVWTGLFADGSEPSVPYGLKGDTGLSDRVCVRVCWDGVLEVISSNRIGVACENPGISGNSSASAV